MEHKEIGVCPICGTEFVKTSPTKKYCTRRCTLISANMAKRARTANSGCPHNEGLICTSRQCDSCGWNPDVAKMRSECYGKG
jgi:hypothetical protein